jgi:hypothetical protein
MCGNCGVEPQAKGHRWCNKCKAEAQLEYNAERDSANEERGFMRGCEAMRAAILKSMGNMNPNGLVQIREFGVWVSQTKVPVFRSRTSE